MYNQHCYNYVCSVWSDIGQSNVEHNTNIYQFIKQVKFPPNNFLFGPFSWSVFINR